VTSQDSSQEDSTQGGPERAGGRGGDPDLWSLPAVDGLDIEWVRYRTPRRRTVGGRTLEVGEAIEIVVRTDGPIPVRALSPALFVGDVQVAENAREDDTTYRFFADEELPPDAPIVLGWVGQPPPPEHRAAAGYRYRPPLEPVVR
jgi:hypothetical protein